VLPPNTCVPGFENEALLLGKRGRRRQGAEEEWENDAAHEEEDVTDSDDDDEHDVDSEHEHELNIDNEHSTGLRRRRDAEDGSRSHSHGLPTFPSINSLFDLLPTSLSTPSSLFGSTTRPATRTLLDTTEQHQPTVLSEFQQSATTNTLASTRSDFSSRTVRHNTMAPKAHTWITLWFLLTAPVILWDASYCFMRPRSFKGGDLHWIWKPYEIYQEVDYVYGVEAYHRGDGFTNAQSFMNLVETALNVYYVYAQHVLASPSAPLIGFASAVMTLSKTVLYWLQEYYCGGCAVGHNDAFTLFWFWIVPNGLWLLIPTLIIYQLSKDISTSLRVNTTTKAGKKD